MAGEVLAIDAAQQGHERDDELHGAVAKDHERREEPDARAEDDPGGAPNTGRSRPPGIDHLPPVRSDDDGQGREHRKGIVLEPRGTDGEEQEDPGRPCQRDAEATPKVRRAQGGREEERTWKKPQDGGQPEATDRERHVVDGLASVEEAQHVLVHDIVAEEVGIARAQKKKPENENQYHDSRAEWWAKIPSERFGTDDERADGGRSEGKNEAHKALGQPRQ